MTDEEAERQAETCAAVGAHAVALLEQGRVVPVDAEGVPTHLLVLLVIPLTKEARSFMASSIPARPREELADVTRALANAMGRVMPETRH